MLSESEIKFRGSVNLIYLVFGVRYLKQQSNYYYGVNFAQKTKINYPKKKLFT